MLNRALTPLFDLMPRCQVSWCPFSRFQRPRLDLDCGLHDFTLLALSYDL